MKSILRWLAVAAVFACSTAKDETTSKVSAAETQLRDIWVLEWMEGHTVDSSTFPRELPLLELNPRDSTVMGHTGCNRLTGKLAAADDGTLSFGPLGTTKMYCDNVPEPAFLDYLTQANGYKRNGLKLELLANGKPLLRFKKVD